MITNGRNGREYRLPELPEYSVEGYCAESKTVYEFLGCFWHGHTCQPFRDVPTLRGDTLADRYEQTMARIERIARAGYQVRVEWECALDDVLRRNPDLRAQPAVAQSPLRTRDALYGGRTEAMRLHYKAQKDETKEYTDIISLYPYIKKYFKFPIGHSTIHVGDACRDIDAMLRMDGLIKCRVLPPKTLYPVLPSKCDARLLFCLCRTCATERNLDAECSHTSVADRALTGVWVLDEVRLAVEKGYEVINVYKVYQYEVTRYDPATGKSGLYVEYVNAFLKLKAEASGYPSWVRSPDYEDRYVWKFGWRGRPTGQGFHPAQRRQTRPRETRSEFHVGEADGKERQYEDHDDERPARAVQIPRDPRGRGRGAAVCQRRGRVGHVAFHR